MKSNASAERESDLLCVDPRAIAFTVLRISPLYFAASSHREAHL